MLRDTSGQDRVLERASSGSVMSRFSRPASPRSSALPCCCVLHAALCRRRQFSRPRASVDRDGRTRQFRARHRRRRAGRRGRESHPVRQRAGHGHAQGARRRHGHQRSGAGRRRQPGSDRETLAGRGLLASLRIDWQRAALDAETEALPSCATPSIRPQVDQKTAQRERDRSRKAYELGSYSELQASKAEDSLEKAQFALQQAKMNYRSAAQTEPFRDRQQEGAARSAAIPGGGSAAPGRRLECPLSRRRPGGPGAGCRPRQRRQGRTAAHGRRSRRRSKWKSK